MEKRVAFGRCEGGSEEDPGGSRRIQGDRGGARRG